MKIIVSLETKDSSDKVKTFGKQLSMHIAASNPLALETNLIDESIINKEYKCISGCKILITKPASTLLNRYYSSTSEEYLNAYENVLKKLKEFKPEFLLFSAGFDAHINDPLAQLRLGSEDFYKITKKTLEFSKSFCNGNVVSILEGGYDLKALQDSTQRHLEALIEFN